MTQVVGKRSKLNQIEVDAFTEVACLCQVIQTCSYPACNLRDLERVRQPVSEKIGLGSREQLGFPLQATKRRSMQQTRIIFPEGRPTSFAAKIKPMIAILATDIIR
ncbi:hypothetical protein AWB77_01491 [Caballeronia fortuita]|uniref:Uncharacterized protein n=1 Tax=Caballeronia fortuita TaxID=1777138 RepID=A0A158A8C0_9BURK|nr:hypothetical protein AWB77_01491 [Caballeronia fortuita]